MINALRSWLGGGGYAVADTVARHRASICAVCPKNVAPNWWERMTKDPIAEAIRSMLEVKNKMQLSIPEESGLHMCRACGCCIKLKIWTPIDSILEHESLTTLAKYPENCWITHPNK